MIQIKLILASIIGIGIIGFLCYFTYMRHEIKSLNSEITSLKITLQTQNAELKQQQEFNTAENNTINSLQLQLSATQSDYNLLQNNIQAPSNIISKGLSDPSNLEQSINDESQKIIKAVNQSLEGTVK